MKSLLLLISLLIYHISVQLSPMTVLIQLNIIGSWYVATTNDGYQPKDTLYCVAQTFV